MVDDMLDDDVAAWNSHVRVIGTPPAGLGVLTSGNL
jgi:hypothetical protein